MKWFLQAFAVNVLSLWLWPPVAALLAGATLYAAPNLISLALAPTLLLCAAIAQSKWQGKHELPRWAWFFDTPDAPQSPYWHYEPRAFPYYQIGEFLGDYLWFAWRNSFNGLAARLGYVYRDGDRIEHAGATWRAWRGPQQVAWMYRPALKLPGGLYLLLWAGWKDLDWMLQNAATPAKITTSGMIVFSLRIRRSPW